MKTHASSVLVRHILAVCVLVLIAPSCEPAPDSPPASAENRVAETDSTVFPPAAVEAAPRVDTLYTGKSRETTTDTGTRDSLDLLGRFEQITVQEEIRVRPGSPQDMATASLDAMGLIPEFEGEETAYRASTSVIRKTTDSVFVLHTMVGGGDDSVAGRRYRVVMARGDSVWAVTEVGRQVQCWPGRGHEDWSDARCK
jgi:hypothetical protein